MASVSMHWTENNGMFLLPGELVTGRTKVSGKVNKVPSVMERDDSWLATVPSVVPTYDCSHRSVHYIH